MYRVLIGGTDLYSTELSRYAAIYVADSLRFKGYSVSILPAEAGVIADRVRRLQASVFLPYREALRYLQVYDWSIMRASGAVLRDRARRESW